MAEYTLIVTEKPDAANRIALALDARGQPQRMQQSGVPYYIAHREHKLLIVPALGHLYTVAASEKGRSQYPIFDYEWVPRYEAEKGASRIRIWLNVISKLAQNADAFIDACDYDIEGSIIGYCILKYTCQGKEKEAKRMKYSTLTSEELEQSYEALLPHLDFALIEAGLTRHEVDWLYGINLTRALTSAAKNITNQYTILSTGRVQGPTLKFLAARERTIACFVPTPYWTLKAKLKIGDELLEAAYEKPTIAVKAEAEATKKKCKTEAGKIEDIQRKNLLQPPPLPFDLGSLQSEAYRLFRYSPIRTSSIAQKLYLDALISYPRTSSQKLPKEIGYQKILKNLAIQREFMAAAGHLLSRPQLKPTEGKKQDSAHPAIYPTGKLPPRQLSGMEKNLYTLIVRRFLAVFGEPALRETMKVTVGIEGERFVLTGSQILEQGWMRFYSPFARLYDIQLPKVNIGLDVEVKKILLQSKFTKPPSRYNPSSMLKKMEQGNIGTKATRAGILQTLYDRKYISEQQIVVTQLGLEVTDVMRKYCPSMVSVEFTRTLEEKMEHIQLNKQTKKQVLIEALSNLKPVAASLKENERAIGEQLSHAIRQSILEERVIGKCPACGTGKLIIQYSKKTGKRFVGCTNFFSGACKTSFPLPQSGLVKPSGKACRSCGWHTVTVLSKGRRAWNLCFNLGCPSKQKAVEA